MTVLPPASLRLKIEALDSTRFELFAMALVAETAARQEQRDRVCFNARPHDRDGGVDFRCEGYDGPVGRLIPRRNTLYQCKSGALGSADAVAAKAVLEKERIRKALSEGWGFVLLAGCDKAGDFQLQLLDSLAKEGLQTEAGQVQLLGSSDLAELCHTLPAVAQEWLGEPVPGGLWEFKKWSGLPGLSNPFASDAALQGQLDEIRRRLEAPKSILVIGGAAGMGKTRAVLEALRGSPLEQTVLYAPEPGRLEPSLSGYLLRTPDCRCTLVVDEVDDLVVRGLIDEFQGAPAQVRLVLVGWDTLPRTTRGIAAMNLSGLDPAVLLEAIQKYACSLPPEQVQALARDSHNCPKLALLLADLLQQHPEIGNPVSGGRGLARAVLGDFRRIGREVWDDLSWMALLTRVGWSSDLDSECDRLFAHAHRPVTEMRGRIADIHERYQIAPQAGRYRYVSPAALADILALQKLTDLTGCQWKALVSSLTPAMLTSLAGRLRRLAREGDEDIQRRIREVLEAPEGPFRSLKDLDRGAASFLRQLAGAVPSAALSVLERLTDIPRDDLRRAIDCRRDLMWSIEELLWFPGSFPLAARVLLRLAAAENETWGNNATGVWKEAFQTVLGRTAAGLAQRLKVLRRAAGGDEAERILAAQALAGALQMHPTSAGIPPEDLPDIPEAWKPSSRDEYSQAVCSYLDLLRPLSADPAPGVRKAAVQALAEGMPIVEELGLIQPWSEVVEGFEREDYDIVAPLSQAVENLLIQCRVRKSEGPRYLAELTRLRDNLDSSSFRGRLRSTLAIWPLREDSPERLEQDLISLAGGILQQPDLLAEELGWLAASADAQKVHRLFSILGELDQEVRLEGPLAEACKNRELSSNCLVAYERARFPVASQAVERLRALHTGPGVIVDLLRFEPQAPGAFETILEELSACPERVASLWHSPWRDRLDAAQVERLAGLAIPANSDQAVYLLEAFLEGHPDSVKQLGPVALEALRSSRPDGNAIRFHTWKVLASKVGASNIPDLFRIALDLGPRASYGADLVSLLVDLWQQGDPVALFEEVVAPRLVEENPSRHWATLRRLKGLPIEEVGLDRLVSWIDAGDRAKRAAALATVAGSPDVPLGTLHARLLEISPEAVGSSLWAGFIEGTHMGPESTWLEQKRQTALQWRSDERGHVRDWAGELVAWLDNNLERARQQEAEEALEGM